MAATRALRLTDRYGAEIDDVSISRLADLLDAIATPDGDDEHRSVSLTDEHEWNLEFYPDRLLFENCDPDGGEIGSLHRLTRAETLAIAQEFIDGNFDRLHTRPWV